MYGFLPDAGRAARLDAARHDDLADSLAHIAEACADPLPAVAGTIAPVVKALRSGKRLRADAFGDYFELGEALFQEDADRAVKAAALLAAVPERGEELEIACRGSGENPRLDRSLDRRLGADASGFAPIAPENCTDFRSLIDEGFGLLRAGFPALEGEIRGIIHEIVLAQAPKGAKMEFDGASHYQFWGLLLLNPKHHPTRLAVAEVLAHEAGHSLLFGLTREEPLVRNPDEELYNSPLRVDPRPMDGIYHATFVSARMALAMETLAESRVLSAEEREQALEAAAKDRENFASGDGVVREHGDLTDSGARIMANARAWIGAT